VITKAKNDYRQRRNHRRGRLKFTAYVLSRLATAGMLAQQAAERREERTPVDTEGDNARRPLVVHYDKEKDETITLSEYRREHPYDSPRSKYAPGYPSNYGDRKGTNLRRYSGIVRPVGFLGMLKGRLFGADGQQL